MYVTVYELRNSTNTHYTQYLCKYFTYTFNQFSFVSFAFVFNSTYAHISNRTNIYRLIQLSCQCYWVYFTVVGFVVATSSFCFVFYTLSNTDDNSFNWNSLSTLKPQLLRCTQFVLHLDICMHYILSKIIERKTSKLVKI